MRSTVNLSVTISTPPDHLANIIAMVFLPATKKNFKNSIIMGRVLGLTMSNFAMQ